MATTNLNPNPAAAKAPRKRVPLVRILVISGIVLGLVVTIPVARFFSWAQCFDLHGFRSSSGSMCPAICENEFVLAGMDAYNKRVPQRGEIIFFEHDQGTTKFIKRVAGVTGDTIARGRANTILVNGAPLTFPTPCGDNNSYSRLASEGTPFEPVKVPERSVFVIGDNLDNSYDSRFFGVIRLDEVKGKALLIYWSPNSSRIGCRIR